MIRFLSRFSCCYLPASVLVLNCSLFGRPGFPCLLVGSDYLGSVLTQQKMGLEGSQFRSDHKWVYLLGQDGAQSLENLLDPTLSQSSENGLSFFRSVYTNFTKDLLCKSERGPIKNITPWRMTQYCSTSRQKLEYIQYSGGLVQLCGTFQSLSALED